MPLNDLIRTQLEQIELEDDLQTVAKNLNDLGDEYEKRGDMAAAARCYLASHGVYESLLKLNHGAENCPEISEMRGY